MPPPLPPRLARFGGITDRDPNARGDSELMRVIRNGPQAVGNRLPEARALVDIVRILALTADPSQTNDAGDTAFSLLEQKDWPLDVKAELLSILLGRQAALSADSAIEGDDIDGSYSSDDDRDWDAKVAGVEFHEKEPAGSAALAAAAAAVSADDARYDYDTESFF